MKSKVCLFSIIGALLGGASFAHAEDPAKSDAGAAASPSAYPLTTCVVSGKKLGAMGDPVVYEYKGEDGKVTEVQFCCKPCTKAFEKDPAKYLKKLDDAKASS